MSNTLILYKTKHHTTQEYAELINSQVKSDLFNIENSSHIDLSSYKVIVFGSWIYDDTIAIAPFIKKNWNILKNKHLILFCDGLTNPEDSKMNDIFKRSLPDYIRQQIYFFPLGGKLSFKSLSIWDKIILILKGKFREENQKNEISIKPIVLKIYYLKILN